MRKAKSIFQEKNEPVWVRPIRRTWSCKIAITSKPHHHPKVASSFIPRARILHVTSSARLGNSQSSAAALV